MDTSSSRLTFNPAVLAILVGCTVVSPLSAVVTSTATPTATQLKGDHWTVRQVAHMNPNTGNDPSSSAAAEAAEAAPEATTACAVQHTSGLHVLADAACAANADRSSWRAADTAEPVLPHRVHVANISEPSVLGWAPDVITTCSSSWSAGKHTLQHSKGHDAASYDGFEDNPGSAPHLTVADVCDNARKQLCSNNANADCNLQVSTGSIAHRAPKRPRVGLGASSEVDVMDDVVDDVIQLNPAVDPSELPQGDVMPAQLPGKGYARLAMMLQQQQELQELLALRKLQQSFWQAALNSLVPRTVSAPQPAAAAAVGVEAPTPVTPAEIQARDRLAALVKQQILASAAPQPAAAAATTATAATAATAAAAEAALVKQQLLAETGRKLARLQALGGLLGETTDGSIQGPAAAPAGATAAPAAVADAAAELLSQHSSETSTDTQGFHSVGSDSYGFAPKPSPWEATEAAALLASPYVVANTSDSPPGWRMPSIDASNVCNATLLFGQRAWLPAGQLGMQKGPGSGNSSSTMLIGRKRLGRPLGAGNKGQLQAPAGTGLTSSSGGGGGGSGGGSGSGGGGGVWGQSGSGVGPLGFSLRSQYTGVYRSRRGEEGWRAQFAFANKVINLGMFDRAEDAARVWNQAALLLRGATTWLNPVEPQLPAGHVPGQLHLTSGRAAAAVRAAAASAGLPDYVINGVKVME